jgi:hypothetical protein
MFTEVFVELYLHSPIRLHDARGSFIFYKSLLLNLILNNSSQSSFSSPISLRGVGLAGDLLSSDIPTKVLYEFLFFASCCVIELKNKVAVYTIIC